MKQLIFLLPLLLLAGCWMQSDCKDLVKSSLKSPSTAKFSSLTTYKTEEFWDVVWWFVESQNWFGAMVWNQFFCVLSWDNSFSVFNTDGDEWTYYEYIYNVINGWETDLVKLDRERKFRGKNDEDTCELLIQEILWVDSVYISNFAVSMDVAWIKQYSGEIWYWGEDLPIFCHKDTTNKMSPETNYIFSISIDGKWYDANNNWK